MIYESEVITEEKKYKLQNALVHLGFNNKKPLVTGIHWI